MASTPPIQNAVIDALSHLGLEHLDTQTAARVWEAIHRWVESYGAPGEASER